MIILNAQSVRSNATLIAPAIVTLVKAIDAIETRLGRNFIFGVFPGQQKRRFISWLNQFKETVNVDKKKCLVPQRTFGDNVGAVEMFIQVRHPEWSIVRRSLELGFPKPTVPNVFRKRTRYTLTT